MKPLLCKGTAGDETPIVELSVIVGVALNFPLFVVMMITPLEPLEPYSAVDEASFNTFMVSICSALMLFRLPL